jgi:hypothetical protein
MARTPTTKILPTEENFLNKIYGINGGPVKITVNSPICFFITRMTEKKVFGRMLELIEIRKPKGNGYFVEENLGKISIKQPLTMIGPEIMFQTHCLNISNNKTYYLTRKNMIIFEITENKIFHSLSLESTVWSKVGV